MTRYGRGTRRLAIAAIVLSLGNSSAWSDDQRDNQGFRPLFNGKDLAGWEATKPEMWSVQDGMIIGRQDKGELKKNTFLATTEKFYDFVVKASVRLVKDQGNSGIQFRSAILPDGTAKGYQADIAKGYWGLLLEEGGRHILKRPDPEGVKQAGFVKVDESNQYVITAKDHHVVVELNGIKSVDLEDVKGDLTGVIALQLHVGEGMEVQFKDIAIKELK